MEIKMKKILKIKALCLLVAVITLVSNVSAVFVGAFNLVIVTGNTHSTTGEGSFLYVMLSDGTCAVTGYVGCGQTYRRYRKAPGKGLPH